MKFADFFSKIEYKSTAFLLILNDCLKYSINLQFTHQSMPISQFLMNNYAKTIEKTDIYAGFLHKCRFWELLAGLEPLTAFQNPFIYKAFSVYTPIARQFDFL